MFLVSEPPRYGALWQQNKKRSAFKKNFFTQNVLPIFNIVLWLIKPSPPRVPCSNPTETDSPALEILKSDSHTAELLQLLQLLQLLPLG
jgi:hypothetical protein